MFLAARKRAARLVYASAHMHNIYHFPQSERWDTGSAAGHLREEGLQLVTERRKALRRQADRELLKGADGPQDRRVDQESKAYRHKRRRAIRHNCGVRIALKLEHRGGTRLDTWSVEEHPVNGRILDLSHEGSSIFTGQQIEIGQALSLVLTLQNAEEVKTAGLVRWSKHIPDRRGFASGVQFEDLPKPARKKIEVFLDYLDQNIGL